MLFRHNTLSALACAILLTACTTTTPPPPSARLATASASLSSADICAGLNALDEKTAGAKLDLPELMVNKIKEIGKTDNEGVCRMTPDERAAIMLVHRNRYKNPKRKSLIPATKEFIRMWDADDNGQQPTTDQILAADSARRQLMRTSENAKKGGISGDAGINSSSWQFIGPGNVGGRIRSVLIDPRNTNRILLGSVTGGMWLSTNGGQSFAPVADFLSNIAIGAMSFDPTNPNIVYAGTGESYQGFSGVGLYKSLDSGLTWSLLSSTSTSLNSDWVYTNRIAVNQANPSIVLAANNGGVYRSSNGGGSWSRVLSGAATDVRIDPNNANNALASKSDGFMYYSRDGGLTWTQSSSLANAGQRAEIAYARSRADLVFISLNNNKGEIWKSEDGGQTWTMMSNPMHLSTQGDYANTIWVSPVDENHLVVGGLDLHQSQDGGLNFTRISTWQAGGEGLPQPHADHHVIVSPANYSLGNPVLYFGNDGGLYRSTNIFNASASGTSTWVNLNNSLGITQFYGGAGKRAAGGKVIGGTQDNGTLVLNSGTNWARFAGGDGGYVAVDPVDDNTLYGEYIYASIHRTVDFNQRQYICTGITEGFATTGGISYCGPNGTQEANFISPFILDPNNRERMLVGANSLWASNNVKDPNPTWSAIKAPDAPGSARQFINSIAVYERDSNIIWVGHNSPGALWKTVNGLSATPTWQRVGQGVLPTSTINRVTIDPDNPNRVWVAYTGFATNRLWQTTDGGTTWRSITANLPAITLHDIKRHPTQTNWLYVAAANGVYTSENGGQSWSTNNDGPAGVRVRELFWYDSTTLIAATYGRGMFSITAAAPAGPLNYSDMWWGGNAENGWGMSIQQHESNVQFNALYVYDNQGLPRWYVMPGGTWNPGFTSYTGLLYQPTSSPFSAYNANQLVVGPSVGNLTINYTSSTATINYTINGVSAQKSIMRQVFGSGTAPFDANDLWWGGSVNAAEGGWGVNIAQQQGTLFVVWYTYGADGRVKWFVMPGGNWSGNSYTGMLYETTSSAWLGVAYNPAALQVLPVGSMTLDFAGISNGRATTATMTYTVNGLTQSKAITRQAF